MSTELNLECCTMQTYHLACNTWNVEWLFTSPSWLLRTLPGVPAAIMDICLISPSDHKDYPGLDLFVLV